MTKRELRSECMEMENLALVLLAKHCCLNTFGARFRRPTSMTCLSSRPLTQVNWLAAERATIPQTDSNHAALPDQSQEKLTLTTNIERKPCAEPPRENHTIRNQHAFNHISNISEPDPMDNSDLPKRPSSC